MPDERKIKKILSNYQLEILIVNFKNWCLTFLIKSIFFIMKTNNFISG